MTMWLAIAITVLASTGNSVGKALQKQATKTLPRFTLDSKALWMYLRSAEWLVGVAADLLGGVLMIAAFALAPVSIVQPVSGVGLASLAVFSHFYLKERLQRWEWAAVALAGLGTVGLGSEPTTPNDSSVSVFRVMAVFGVSLAAMGALLLLQQHAPPSGGSGGGKPDLQPRRWATTVCGLQAGGCFGLSAASCRIGILLSEQYFLWLLVGLTASILLTSLGFVLQTRGLKDGNTMLVCTCASVSAMVAGVAVGILGLGEELPATLRGKLLRLWCWGCILSGVAMIASGPGGAQVAASKLASLLPRWLWGLLPTDAAIRLRQAAQKMELPVTHQAAN